MDSRWVLRAAGVLTVLSAAFGPAPAQAFCRESVKSEPSGPCVEKPGVPLLHWTRPCLTYVFNDQLFSRLRMLTEDEIRDTFDQSFQTWSDVDCGGSSPLFFVEQDPGTTPTSKAEFVYDQPNEAVIVARTRSEWEALPNHDPTALAFTLLWHDKNTGEILDVDMELNTGAGIFDDCERRGCTGSRSMVDLSNTITHEAGHLLGLGHTTVRAATMTTTAIGAETEKRTLEEDDRRGYCALDLPEFECENADCTCAAPPIYPSQRTVRTCACRVPGGVAESGAGWGPGGFVWLGMLGVLAGLRLRRRVSTAAQRSRSAQHSAKFF